MMLIMPEQPFVNRNYLKLVLLLIVICFNTLNVVDVYAQKHQSAPLFDFFEKNADSTIVLSHLQNIYEYPDYFIVSKKGDTINMYTYRYRNLIETPHVDVPKAFAKAIARVNYTAIDQAPSINTLLKVMVVDKQSLTTFWKDLMNEQIWHIKDDAIDGEGCPIVKGKNPVQLFDGGGPLFKLITKDGIKDLKFYSSIFYEVHCPGRSGRISAIKIQELFKTYFTRAGEQDFGKVKKLHYLFRNSY
ncbi:hypothetical protein ACEN2P_03480 [Pedobacter psychrotolerans]|uniref:hypothetical protein n=1 Tax=Pedobacter psychrotolerans TaxID=1843235 RepID=UPI003F956FC8